MLFNDCSLISDFSIRNNIHQMIKHFSHSKISDGKIYFYANSGSIFFDKNQSESNLRFKIKINPAGKVEFKAQKHDGLSPQAKKIIDRTIDRINSILESTDLSEIQDSFTKLDFIQSRIFAYKFLSEAKIKKFYVDLFKTNLSSISKQLSNDSSYCCSIIQDLYTSIQDLESNSELKTKIGNGVNGSYFISNSQGKKIWVMKPENEESDDCPEGIKKGQGAKREHVSYILNPITTPVTVYAQVNGQISSFQRCILEAIPLHVIETSQNGESKIRTLHALDLQISLLFDLRFHNWDRHKGNLMVATDGHTWTIDHGGCMTASQEDPLKIEQFKLPQMKENWEEEIVKMILSLNESKIAEDEAIMQVHGMPDQTIQRMKNASHIISNLVKISEQSRGEGGPTITPYDIARIFVKRQNEIWDENNIDSFIELGHSITKYKSEAQRFTSIRVGVIKLGREYKGNDAEILFGSCDSEREESIIGEYLTAFLAKNG